MYNHMRQTWLKIQ